MSDFSSHSELVVLIPERSVNSRHLLARMADMGVLFHFEPHYRLPEKFPQGVRNAKLVLSAPEDVPSEIPSGLKWLGIPDHYWESDNFIERVPMLGDLTLHHPEMKLRLEAISDEEVLEATLRRMSEYVYTNWNDVLRYNMECLWQYYLLTGDMQAKEKALGLAREALADRPARAENVDYLACLNPILNMAEALPETDAISFAKELCSGYIASAPRLRGVLNNFLSHLEAGILRSEVAFQACPTFIRLSRVSGDPKYADEAVEQLLLLDKELTDEKTGLWHLGCTEKKCTPVLWARGTVFAMRGILDALAELADSHRSRSRLLSIAHRQAEALVKLQDSEGMWHQVLDESDTRPECSASCWAVSALAFSQELNIGNGETHAAAERGWRALKRKSWDGLPVNLCAQITASFDPDYFRHRVFAPAVHGHFLSCAALQMFKNKTLRP